MTLLNTKRLGVAWTWKVASPPCPHHLHRIVQPQARIVGAASVAATLLSLVSRKINGGLSAYQHVSRVSTWMILLNTRRLGAAQVWVPDACSVAEQDSDGPVMDLLLSFARYFGNPCDDQRSSINIILIQ